MRLELYGYVCGYNLPYGHINHCFPLKNQKVFVGIFFMFVLGQSRISMSSRNKSYFNRASIEKVKKDGLLI